MLARRQLPDDYRAFNEKHGAPFGNQRFHVRQLKRRLGRLHPLTIRSAGPYAFQPNNTLREVEYPWVFEQVSRLGHHLVVVDVGASLGGMQYTLARAGHEVHAVDPGMQASGRGWEVDPDFHQRLAAVFKAPVRLHPTTLDQTDLADGSVDVVMSISTIEHFGQGDLEAFAEHARRVLRPGGHVVLTIDLFLDLQPFTSRERNRYGVNTDVRHLLEMLGGELVFGDSRELCGFPEFDPARIQCELAEYKLGAGYPAMSQLVVAQVG